MSGMDLHLLPKMRDGLSYLYVEHCTVYKEAKAIAIHDADGKVPVPCASLALLMLGPGTRVTHAAIQTLAEHGCLVEWVGEEGVRFYAQGSGETRSAANLLRQSWLAADPVRRLAVVRRMYARRFPEKLPASLTLQQLRGREGVRVREAYAHASRESGVPWQGRTYNRGDWAQADPVNRALSCANSCLYGICHAAIVSAGYSPALGFVHTGKMLSFVYDIADLYKAELTIPAAFRAAMEGGSDLEKRTRYTCRDAFRTGKLLARIVNDIDAVTAVAGIPVGETMDFDFDAAAPGGLWDPEHGAVAGGENYADDSDADADTEEETE